ncbi:GntR family transcriptional regulator [Actinomadura sp. DC4]|uniref:GntR family transcriptional regulator n=1 Tax=Actinomadura sp. DC4 TaxID=3055069 RepID=UPI0025AFB436|nr:GntR family transcriptional regulator [Actinomadura sp. DC4]
MAERPLYQRIAEELRLKIETGELSPGSLVPPESQLTVDYKASRNTIREAVRWLKDLGLVDTQPGRGTTVISKPVPFEITLTPDSETGFGGGEGAAYIAEVQAQNRVARAGSPKVEIHKAKGRIAEELGLAVDAEVISRHQQRYIDDTPWSLQTSYYPVDFVARGATRLLSADDIEEGTVRYIEGALGIKQASYTDRITVRAPDVNEVAFFDLPANGSVPVFQTYRTARDTEARPFRLTVSVFAADRNEFLLNVDLTDMP